METSGLYLLDTTTRATVDPRTLPTDFEYAILSHCWNEKETTLQEYEKLYEAHETRLRNADLNTNFGTTDEEKALEKIAKTCWLAQQDELKYAWIDTCCINKENRTEQEKAFASMYKLYERASFCHVYLSDVSSKSEEYVKTDEGDYIIGPFKKSRWFKRGWTLQELLAPKAKNMIFYDYKWRSMGTKATLLAKVATASGIESTHLLGGHKHACIAVKMSWLAQRETRYPEDMAYCMLGLFDVSIYVRYDQGPKAFRRLQEELIARTSDESIFAWTIQDTPFSRVGATGLLAPSPECFATCGNLTIQPANPKDYKRRVKYAVHDDGIRFQIPAKHADHGNGPAWNNFEACKRTNYKLSLNCWDQNAHRGDRAVVLHLLRTDRDHWRRIDGVEQMWGEKPKGSFSIVGTKVRPMDVPHDVEQDADESGPGEMKFSFGEKVAMLLHIGMGG